MPTQSLEDLDFENEKDKITPSEPEGAEVSTFVQWDGDVSGEISSTDKKIPRLNLGQKSGVLGEAKGFGNLILNKETVIAPFGQLITAVTVLKIRKQYQERRPYDPSSTTLPDMFNTAKEALAAGYATEWPTGPRKGDEKLALPIAHLLFFIPSPAGLDQSTVEQEFIYEFNGRRYVAAVFTTSATSYADTAKPVFTYLDTPKGREIGLRGAKWMLRADKRQNAKNSWFTLKNTIAGYNDSKFIEYTKTTLP